MDLNNISSDNKTITNKTSNLITNSAIVSNDITNPELSTPKISYTPRIFICPSIRVLNKQKKASDNKKSLGFSATCSKCVDLKLKCMKNLTIHGRKKKFVVPFSHLLGFSLVVLPLDRILSRASSKSPLPLERPPPTRATSPHASSHSRTFPMGSMLKREPSLQGCG